MICFLKEMNDIQKNAIFDYWSFNESGLQFKYTVDEIESAYKSHYIRNLSEIASNTRYSSNHSIFFCSQCNCKTPTKNRFEYNNRIKASHTVLCTECSLQEKENELERAKEILNDFFLSNFCSKADLENLSLEESIALLCLNEPENLIDSDLGNNFSSTELTGIEAIDYTIIDSLIKKNILIDISEVPKNVEKAEKLLLKTVKKISYIHKALGPIEYKLSKSHPISIGTFLNKGISQDYINLIHQKVSFSKYSLDDISKLRRTIHEIQYSKLYTLISSTIIEHNLKIENSAALSSLLTALSEEYPADKLYYLFRSQAVCVILYSRKNSVNPIVESRLFTKFLGNSISKIKNGTKLLEKSWAISEQMRTYPFETLISRIFLDTHVNWHYLSTREVTSMILETINIIEE